MRRLLLILALIEGLWMTFDGLHGLVVGDYVTPSSGPRAGELGPWSRIVSAIGIPPRSTAMKLIFVVYGSSWLSIALAWSVGERRARWAMLVAALATLWYLPVGVMFGIFQIPGLLWLRPESR
ncbi:MAG TPA: hypothetical protein VGJ62_07965 [Gemmatimonadaceae bacterium]|jgi:hypothetical protein